MHSESPAILSGEEADGEEIVINSRPPATTTSHTSTVLPVDFVQLYTLTCTECEKTHRGSRLPPETGRPVTYSLCVDCGITLHDVLPDADPNEIPYPPTHAPYCTFQNRIRKDQEARQALHFFPLLARTRHLISGALQGKDLHGGLEDAIQMSLGASAGSASTLPLVPTAMMAMRLPTSRSKKPSGFTLTEDSDDDAPDPDEVKDQRVTFRYLEPRPKTAARRPDAEDEALTRDVASASSSLPMNMAHAHLPVINPRRDKRVFAFLDECCNKTCHSRSWDEYAVDRGMEFGKLHGEPRSFKGLGSAKALGKRACYIAFGGYQSITSPRSHNDIVPDVIFDSTVHSHEIEKGDNLMLISLAAQGTLGLVKDVAAGTCYMKGEQIWMQLYSIAGSSLRAVCVYDPSWKNNTAMHSVGVYCSTDFFQEFSRTSKAPDTVEKVFFSA